MAENCVRSRSLLTTYRPFNKLRAARPGLGITIVPPLQRTQIVELGCLEPVAEGLHTYPLNPARIWLGRPLLTASSLPPANAPHAESCTASICNRTGPLTGGRLAWMLSSSSGPKRSSGATPTLIAWPSGAIGWSAPMRSSTIKFWEYAGRAGYATGSEPEGHPD